MLRKGERQTVTATVGNSAPPDRARGAIQPGDVIVAELSRAEYDAMLRGDDSASAGASAKPDQSKTSSGTK